MKNNRDKLKQFVSTNGKYAFIISEAILTESSWEEFINAYMYVIEDWKCIRDELQDTISNCQDVANEMYWISINSWRPITKVDILKKYWYKYYD